MNQKQSNQHFVQKVHDAMELFTELVMQELPNK